MKKFCSRFVWKSYRLCEKLAGQSLTRTRYGESRALLDMTACNDEIYRQLSEGAPKMIAGWVPWNCGR